MIQEITIKTTFKNLQEVLSLCTNQEYALALLEDTLEDYKNLFNKEGDDVTEFVKNFSFVTTQGTVIKAICKSVDYKKAITMTTCFVALFKKYKDIQEYERDNGRDYDNIQIDKDGTTIISFEHRLHLPRINEI